MSKDFNWKPYYIGVAIIVAISAIVNIKVGIGYATGSIFYYLNDRLNLKKFPSLDATGKAVGSMLLIMAVQGILVIIAGLTSWFIGKLPCFLACFAGLIIPSVYFFFMSYKKR